MIRAPGAVVRLLGAIFAIEGLVGLLVPEAFRALVVWLHAWMRLRMAAFGGYPRLHYWRLDLLSYGVQANVDPLPDVADRTAAWTRLKDRHGSARLEAKFRVGPRLRLAGGMADSVGPPRADRRARRDGLVEGWSVHESTYFAFKSGWAAHEDGDE